MRTDEKNNNMLKSSSDDDDKGELIISSNSRNDNKNQNNVGGSVNNERASLLVLSSPNATNSNKKRPPLLPPSGRSVVTADKNKNSDVKANHINIMSGDVNNNNNNNNMSSLGDSNDTNNINNNSNSNSNSNGGEVVINVNNNNPGFGMMTRRYSFSDDNSVNNNSQASSTSRLLWPWAFQNLSGRIVPSDHEQTELNRDAGTHHLPTNNNRYRTNDDDNDVYCSDASSSLDDQDEQHSLLHQTYYQQHDGYHYQHPPNYYSSHDPIPNQITASHPPVEETENYNNYNYNHTDDMKQSYNNRHQRKKKNRRRKKMHHKKYSSRRIGRSFRRRLFLVLTEPESSLVSAIFYAVLITAIFLSIIFMIMETMHHFQYTPASCDLCGGSNNAFINNDDNDVLIGQLPPNVQCICPPAPYPALVQAEDIIIYFFTVEWLLRVLCYEPKFYDPHHMTILHRIKIFIDYLTSTPTVLDALAIFPYYLERYDVNGLLSLRLLRLFRIFQVLRLGQYNHHFMCLANVMLESIQTLNLLIIVIFFGAAIFGSTMYWMEKGQWEYTETTEPPTFAYVRLAADGITKELTPFTSIPAAFWWFIVTATTVGYGDASPTSTGGKLIACLAMLTGVLVIAFPVSIFSDLWSKQLQTFQKDTNDTNNKNNNNDPISTTDPSPPNKNAKDQNTNLTPADIQSIHKHLALIEQSQTEIRLLLQKNK